MPRHKTRNFRPNPAYYEPAEAAAEQAGISMTVLLQAMLREFIADPAARFAALAEHLQAVAAETPRRGRPSRQTTGRDQSGAITPDTAEDDPNTMEVRDNADARIGGSNG